MNCPFAVNRVFYLYDVPGGTGRAGHAHRRSHQLLIAASGSFDVLTDDGYSRRSVSLNRPYYGLHVVPGIWAELSNFSSGSICLVLSCSPYEPEEYVRDYSEFRGWKRDDREAALARAAIHRRDVEQLS